MGSRKQAERRKRQAEVERRRRDRLRDPDGWRPPPPPEAASLGLGPLAAPEEPLGDIAVFDDAALASLPPETRAEAEIVREALNLAAAGEPDAALDRLGPIGRKSVYADWRLLVRGLAPFQKGDLIAARDAWSRLAADRRPGRIAAVLTTAWGQVREAPRDAGQRAAGDGPLAAAVAVLRRSSLWTAAREVLAIRHRDKERTFSASQAALVIRLEKQYRAIDPDFVQDFSVACRFLAMGQDDAEPLSALCRGTAGPADDPRSTRLQLVYLMMYDAEPRELVACIRDYVDRDLAGVDRDLAGVVHLPAALRAALASCALCRTAESIIAVEMNGPFGGLSHEEEQICERLLREAIERFPRNPRAHEVLVELLQNRAAENLGSRDAERAVFAAKTALVEQFPDRHGQVVDLVNRLAGNGEFDKAEPFVRLLADQRCTEPAARAMPWRFPLMRASWLATKEAGLPQAREALAAAIAAWPTWMSRRWIPFLEATLLLREGDAAGHAAAVEAARQATPHRLHADVLEYEAVVRLGGQPSHVKSLAAALRSSAKQVAIDADVGPLVDVGCFYLDLERSGLDLMVGHDHPARPLGRALVKRLGAQGKRSLGAVSGAAAELPVDEPAFWAAFRWLANHGFFDAFKPKREPAGIARLADSHPRAAAEVLFWLASTDPDSLTTRKSRKRLALVEGFLPGETNSVVRDWLTTIVARVRKELEGAEQRKRQARRGSPFGFGLPRPPGLKPSSTMPPVVRLILDRGGPAALAELVPVIMGPQSEKSADRLAALCKRYGISLEDMLEAIDETMPD